MLLGVVRLLQYSIAMRASLWVLFFMLSSERTACRLGLKFCEWCASFVLSVNRAFRLF